MDPRAASGSVEWFMSRNIRSIGPDANLGEACAEFLDLKVGALPVVEDGKLVGILSVLDIVGVAAKLLAR
ncbi:MAG: CBS domain-containing protein [Proteobacteria bacterium]|nr:CBS domain-containing protein [Pseudomonadota bacterium]